MIFAKRRGSGFVPVAAVLVLCVAAVAWSQETETPERLTRPERPVAQAAREVVVAAPRGSIAWAVPHPPHIGPDAASDEDLLPTFQVGAVENFAAREISLVVPLGKCVFFRESRHIEGVWYERTFGRMATLMLVQIKNPTGTTPEWITLGRDGAGAIWHGPRIGTARVGVRVEFKRLGDFELRAIVVTGAVPMYLDPDNPDAEPTDSPYADFDVDVIPIKVSVVDSPDPADLEAEIVPRDQNLGYLEPLQPLFQE